ncbi:MAG: glycosyltransferase family 4 protein [Terriglobales bacterium]
MPPPERNNAPLAILFVGHLIERKGAHLVLEAARHFPQARFRMIGHARDDFGHNLKLTLRGAGLANVSIEDPVSQAQMVRIMQESDILLLPSRVEGIPKVTLEAAAAGLPCVVFDDYQTPSVVDGVTGFQVKKFEEMLVRLQLLIQDHELRRRMCAAAVAHAKSFDWDRVAAQWGDILGNLEQRVGVAEK